MLEKALSNPLLGGLLDRKPTKPLKLEMNSNLDELFKNTDNSAYVNELKKAIFHIERLSPKEIPTPFRGTCLEISHSGKYFIFGSNEGRIALIDKDTKEIVQEFLQEGGVVYSIAIYSNDKFILSAGKDGIIRKFLYSDFSLERLFIGHTKEVNKVVLAVNELKFYSASDDCTVREWDDLNSTNEVLYSHDKPVLTIDRSSCGKFLVSGGADKKILVFDLKDRQVVHVINDLNSAVWAVKISKSGKYLAAGDANAMVRLWDFDKFEVLRNFAGHSKRISHLEFNNKEESLVSSSNDGTLRIWNILMDKNEIVLTGHTDWVKHFRISNDDKYIFSIAENFKILCWYFPKFDTSCRKKIHSGRVNSICVMQKNNLNSQDLIFSADSKEIHVWIAENRAVYRSLASKSEITSICSQGKTGVLLVALANKEVCSWKIEELHMKMLFKHGSLVKVMKMSNDGMYLALGDSNFRVTILNARNYETVSVNRRHNSAVTSIVFDLPESGVSKKMYSGGSDNKIFVYNLEKPSKSKKFGQHASGITTLAISRQNHLIVSGDEAGCLKIWKISAKVCIMMLEALSDRITGIYFTLNEKYFWVSSADLTLSLWNLVNYTMVTKIQTRGEIAGFCVDSEENDLILAENEDLYFFPNILKVNQFFIYGPGNDHYSFMKYIMEMCEGNEQVHIPSMNNWIILPFEFNALHLYAYFNLPLHLKQAMNAMGPFYNSKSNISPLHIAVERNFRDCINEIIRIIRFRVEDDPYSVFYLQDQIVKLNKVGFRGLDELYESILYKVSDKALPKFVSEDTELPILKLSDSLGPKAKTFFGNKEIPTGGVAVSFYQSALQVDMGIGSQESLDFLESLVECPNNNIFTTQFIRELILYKWKYVKWLLLPQAFTYFFYMISLSYYLIAENGEKSPVLVGLLFAFNVILTLYEIYQMFLTGLSYFTDPWNYIDISRFSICFAYCIMSWIEYDENLNKQVLVVLTFTTMLRGISYFRLFDKTRYMINLLKEVFSDMTSFIILLTYSTYSFALIYFIMINNINAEQNAAEPKPFSEFIAEAYLLNLGDFDTTGYGAFEWMIFFFASVINPLIMLNLLISLMGETYGRVKEEQEIADMKELAQMVIEGEYLLYCKRKSQDNKFIHICAEEEVTAAVSTPMDRVDKLKRRIKAIQLNMNSKHEETKNEIKNSIGGVSSKLDEMGTLIEQINFNQE